MNDEILNNNGEQPDEKELLRQRREEQIERVKAQYETDVKEKAEAKIRMEKEQELEKELAKAHWFLRNRIQQEQENN